MTIYPLNQRQEYLVIIIVLESNHILPLILFIFPNAVSAIQRWPVKSTLKLFGNEFRWEMISFCY